MQWSRPGRQRGERFKFGSTPTIGILAAILFAAASPAQAVDKFAAEFLKVGVGARALGMGGAFVSIADDASATYWNPAGMVQLAGREALGMHASQFGGVVDHDVLGMVSPLRTGSRRTAIGVTLVRLAVDDIRVTSGFRDSTGPDGIPILVDENGNEVAPEDIPRKSAYDLALLLSYARGIGDRWSAGVNIKLIRQSLVGEGASFGVGADLGFLFQPKPNLAFGVRIADVTTTQLYWDTGRRETVAPTITIGAHTTRNLAALQGKVTVVVNAGFSFEGQEADQFATGDISGNFLPGMEYWFQDTVAFRAGFDAGNLTAGAGIRYRQVGADYAFLSHDELDGTHRISALVRF